MATSTIEHESTDGIGVKAHMRVGPTHPATLACKLAKNETAVAWNKHAWLLSLPYEPAEGPCPASTERYCAACAKHPLHEACIAAERIAEPAHLMKHA